MKTIKNITITTPNGAKVKPENAQFDVPFNVMVPAKTSSGQLESISLARCDNEIVALEDLKVSITDHLAKRIAEIDSEILFWTDVKNTAIPLINAKNFSE